MPLAAERTDTHALEHARTRGRQPLVPRVCAHSTCMVAAAPAAAAGAVWQPSRGTAAAVRSWPTHGRRLLPAWVAAASGDVAGGNHKRTLGRNSAPCRAARCWCLQPCCLAEEARSRQLQPPSTAPHRGRRSLECTCIVHAAAAGMRAIQRHVSNSYTCRFASNNSRHTGCAPSGSCCHACSPALQPRTPGPQQH